MQNDNNNEAHAPHLWFTFNNINNLSSETTTPALPFNNISTQTQSSILSNNTNSNYQNNIITDIYGSNNYSNSFYNTNCASHYQNIHCNNNCSKNNDNNIKNYKIGYLNVCNNTSKMMYEYCISQIGCKTIDVNNIITNYNNINNNNNGGETMDALVIFEPTQIFEILQMFGNEATTSIETKNHQLKLLNQRLQNGLQTSFDGCTQSLTQILSILNHNNKNKHLKAVFFVCFTVANSEMNKMPSILHELYQMRDERIAATCNLMKIICNKYNINFYDSFIDHDLSCNWNDNVSSSYHTSTLHSKNESNIDNDNNSNNDNNVDVGNVMTKYQLPQYIKNILQSY